MQPETALANQQAPSLDRGKQNICSSLQNNMYK
jgi:hypothetical protein